jgi:protein-S-isoprenylcysteine O-methyltransferase Ste14
VAEVDASMNAPRALPAVQVVFTSWMLATPLLLGSAWALIPAALSILAILIRTALEDRTLRAELSGYAGYAKRVRFRLVPGLW